jgi:hypothetical protein
MTNAMDEFDELFFNDDNNECQNSGNGIHERRFREDENPSSSNKFGVNNNNNDDEGRTAIVGILPSTGQGGGGEFTTTSDQRNPRSTVGMNTNTNTKNKKHSDSSSKNDDVISIGSSSSSSLDQSVSSSSSSTSSTSDGSSDGNYASTKNKKVSDSKFSTTTVMTASATRRGGETNNDTSPTKSISSSKSSSLNDTTTMKKKKKYECGDNIAMLDANLDDFLEEDEDDEDDDLLTSFFSTTTSPTATSVKKTDGGKTSLAYGSMKTTTTLLRNMSHVANSTNDETWGDTDNEKDGQCCRIGGGEQQLPSSSSSSSTTALRNDHRFDTLDDDTLAELEETDSQDGTSDTNKGGGGGVPTQHGVEPHAIHSPSSSTLETSMLKLPNDFTISYNCEKRECPFEEELLDFSDEEEEEAVLHGNNSHRRTNKENSSPNKKKSSTTSSSPSPKMGKTSNYFEEHTDNDDDDDIALNFFDNDTDDNNLQSSKKSVPSPAPDSPTSLDTPRESSSIASPPMLVSIKSAITSTMKVDNPPTSATATVNQRQEQSSNNPYYAPQQQQRKQNYQLNGLGMTKNDQQENMTVPSSTNSTSTTGVISLPDLGLSPLAHQNELQQLGINHNHYKPTSLRTTITTTSSNPEDPIVHKLNTLNRPVHNRRTTAVHTIFSSPVKELWKQSKFTCFNHVQTEMAPILANSDDNVIVSAPTGAGKTALFEMAMARLFTTLNQQSSRQHQQHGIGGVGGGIIVSKARKIVYIAPNKALCEERQIDWSKRLVDIDPSIVCTTITGDVNASSCYTEITLANLILTTPEKWDSITRRWNEHFVLLSCIKLVLIDEVHLIGETDRGGCLESIICRMKTIQRAACARMLTASEIASSRYV